MRRKARLVISSVGLGALLAGVALGASGARAKASTGEGTAPIDRVERIRAALLDHDRRQAGGDARDSLDPVAAWAKWNNWNNWNNWGNWKKV